MPFLIFINVNTLFLEEKFTKKTQIIKKILSILLQIELINKKSCWNNIRWKFWDFCNIYSPNSFKNKNLSSLIS